MPSRRTGTGDERHAISAAQAVALVLLLLLTGCAGPLTKPARTAGRDGPGANPPPELWRVPDAEPRIDPVRSGGPNKPYEVMGQAYVPQLGDPPMAERGLASWYGAKFHGLPTATGETYDMYAMTAAHKTMPLPSYARVRNPANGREVVVRVNDRGPFHPERVIDLSYTAALKLGVLGAVAPVEVERITQESIRSGSWRGLGAETAMAASAPAVAASIDPIVEIAYRETAVPASGTRAPEAAPAAASRSGYWLQLGAFREPASADSWWRQLQQQAAWLAPQLSVSGDANWQRVQAGPYATRAEAVAVAERLREQMKLSPVLLDRR